MNNPNRSRTNQLVSASVGSCNSCKTFPLFVASPAAAPVSRSTSHLTASEPRHGYALHEPALRQQVDDYGGDGGDGGRSHEQIPVGAVLALEVAQADHDRDRRVAVGDHQGPQKMVPVEQK